MPWDIRGFIEMAAGAPRPGSNPSRHRALYHYVTDDAHATAAAAGYFNPVRMMLTVGDVIIAVTAAGTTPVLRFYVVTAVPASGNITVAQVQNA
jgi:hypothetical protein